jgi:hypothetical protein
MVGEGAKEGEGEKKGKCRPDHCTGFRESSVCQKGGAQGRAAGDQMCPRVCQGPSPRVARALEALGRTEEAAEIKSQIDDFEIAAHHSYPTLEIALFSVGWLAYEGQIFIYAPTLQHAVHEYLRRRLRGSTQAYPLESVRCP